MQQGGDVGKQPWRAKNRTGFCAYHSISLHQPPPFMKRKPPPVITSGFVRRGTATYPTMTHKLVWTSEDGGLRPVDTTHPIDLIQCKQISLSHTHTGMHKHTRVRVAVMQTTSSITETVAHARTYGSNLAKRLNISHKSSAQQLHEWLTTQRGLHKRTAVCVFLFACVLLCAATRAHTPAR